jgi:hypothetical protein
MKHLSMCLLLAAAACGGGAAPKAPPPFRPKAVETPPPPPTAEGPTDCQPTTTKDQLPAVTYQERSLDEAADLANAGLNDLKAAETPGVDKVEKERLVTSAVQLFIQALLADPYNVDATYNLAAAYARIGRPQCSLNLLERLLQMRSHPSKNEAVEKKLDRLLGRKKQNIDPDFNSMRGDARFRTLIKQMCAGSSDGDCAGS